MAVTNEDMDIEKEQKDHKIEILQNKMGLPDSKVTEVRKKLGLKEISSQEKVIEKWID